MRIAPHILAVSVSFLCCHASLIAMETPPVVPQPPANVAQEAVIRLVDGRVEITLTMGDPPNAGLCVEALRVLKVSKAVVVDSEKRSIESLDAFKAQIVDAAKKAGIAIRTEAQNTGRTDRP